MISNLNDKLDIMFPEARCELEYSKDYELLIATVLSAQCTDKRVNSCTKILFGKYKSLDSLSKANKKDIEGIIRSCGNQIKKSQYILEIAKRLLNECNGIVPNDRKYLESLPGVGRKTTNIVLSNIYNLPAIAVDTHVARVSKRLRLANKKDDVLVIEKKLMKKIPVDKWGRSHHQLVLFGRYICKAVKPECDKCLFYEECNSKDKRNRI